MYKCIDNSVCDYHTLTNNLKIKVFLLQAVFEVNYCPSTIPLGFEFVLELQAGKKVAVIHEVVKPTLYLIIIDRSPLTTKQSSLM